MKRKELRQLISEAIREILFESASGFETMTLDQFIEKSHPVSEAVWDDVKTKSADYNKYLDARLNPEKESGKPSAAKLGRLMHKSNIVDEKGNPVDERKLISLIKVRPEKILGRNSKLKHSNNKQFMFYDTTLPAYQGFYVDEANNELKIIRTCPAAGACAKFCYAAKGGYIQYKHSSLSSTRLVNFLVNDPEGYKNKLISEIKAEEAKLAKKKIIPVIRWHDAGDFFSKRYLDLAYEVANATPKTIHYAYTKALRMVKQTTPPKNFVFNFSTGGIHDKEIDTTKDKFSEVVPSEMFADLIDKTESGKHKTDEKGFKKFKDGGLEELKHRIAVGYKIPEKSIVTWNELMKIPYNPDVDTIPKYNVIVYAGAGDNSAMRKDVLGTYLLIH